MAELDDLDKLNHGGIRVIVGAIDLSTALIRYFDNSDLSFEHVVASGSLPPGTPPGVYADLVRALAGSDTRVAITFGDGGLAAQTPHNRERSRPSGNGGRLRSASFPVSSATIACASRCASASRPTSRVRLSETNGTRIEARIKSMTRRRGERSVPFTVRTLQ